MEKPVIICVDDEKSVLNGLRDELKFEFGANYSIEISDSGEEGLVLIGDILESGIEIPVVISDQLMPGMKGDEFLAEVYKMNEHIRKILLTGQATAEAVGNAVNNARLYRYMAKPWDARDLLMTVQQAAKSYQQDKELDARIQILNDLNESAYLLAQEIHPHKLLEKILRVTMLPLRVDRGIIVLLNQDFLPDRVLFAERKGDNLTYQTIPAQELASIAPADVILEVCQNRLPVDIEKSMRDDKTKSDEVVKSKKIKSIFSFPILKGEEFLCVIYLDSTQTSEFFHPLKKDYLSVLSRQIGISLDNALLYENLELRVKERTQEIENQKKIIESKNEDITDSIQYARRIQNSLFPDISVLKDYFKDSFVIYEPKDIVSGDFYWFAEIDSSLFVAAVDCTGHGVPGAFMSILGSSLLTEIVRERRILNPAAALRELHLRLMQNLQQKGNDKVQDGMELSLCRYDLQTRELEYALATRPLYHIHNGMGQELILNKEPIGFSAVIDNDDRNFNTGKMSLQSGDCFYQFSDGFTDQFGGGSARKFSKKAFYEVLNNIQTQDMPSQEIAIRKALQDWKGNLPQTDDILVIGIRIP